MSSKIRASVFNGIDLSIYIKNFITTGGRTDFWIWGRSGCGSGACAAVRERSELVIVITRAWSDGR